MRALRIARAGILATALATAACDGLPSSTPEPEAPQTVIVELGSQFRLAPGSSGRLGDGGLEVVFREVSGDSRCPTDAECVWGGDGTVVLTTSIANAAPARHEVHTAVQPKDFIVDGYRIELVALDPKPVSSRTIAPADYRADLRVTRV